VTVARAINADFTLFRDLDANDEGDLEAMTTRHDVCAIDRTAATAGSAATLILGSLLLLIRP
jgi:hypothetical protein